MTGLKKMWDYNSSITVSVNFRHKSYSNIYIRLIIHSLDQQAYADSLFSNPSFGYFLHKDE